MNTKQKDDGVWGIEELEDLEEKVIKPNQWVAVGSKTFKAVSVTHNSIPAGCYSITMDRTDGASIFTGKRIKIDDIISFKDGLTEKILKEVNDFWGKEKTFKANGFLHRRGFLLYGGAGTGKSSIVWQIAQDVIKRDGIVFVCQNPEYFSKGLTVFRQVELDRPIVCIFEDIDAIISKYGDTEILQLLDGDNQVDRVINLATTNFPEKLDKRIVSRPRRFDRLYKILNPSDSIRIQFLKKKLSGIKGQDIKEWIKKTKNLSFAALTESLISVLCLGNDLNETIEILRDIESKEPKISDFGTGKVGFKMDEKDDDLDGEDPYLPNFIKKTNQD